jgi:hypothetical protein
LYTAIISVLSSDEKVVTSQMTQKEINDIVKMKR